MDIFGGVETRQQYDMLPSNLKLSKQLDLREGSRTQTSHNVYERFSTVQHGGTCILAQEAIGSFVSEHGSDTEGLGRWSWLKLTGKSITTRIVVAYMPCTTRKQAVYATIAQQRRYWKLQGNKQRPRKLLQQDLIRQLKEWRNQGEKLILFLDSNGNMLNGPLSRMLAHTDLGMIDAVHHRSGLPGPHTFIKGSRQIDGAWVTLDVDIDRSCFLPFYFGVGDHRGILMDVPQRTILGGDIHKISRPAARRLSCNKREVMGKYNDLLEIFCSQHRIQQKLYTLFPPTFPPSPAIAAKMEVIDRVLGEGMIHTEKKNVAKSRGVKFLLATNSLQQVAVLNYGVWSSVTNDPTICPPAPFAVQPKKCNLTQVLTVSIETARHYLKCAWTNYKIHKKSAP